MKPSSRHYRIGDFAKYMGVTPDFLKHYEAHGLLNVQQRESSYRFYAFDQASRILEYMRLKNYGVSVKDMRAMLSAADLEAMDLLDDKAEDLQRQADKLLAVIEEHKRVKAWCAKRRLKPVDWDIRDVETHYFLPHSNNKDFIKDKRIYELLRTWVDWMPIAKSALKVDPVDTPDELMPNSWGLILPESVTRRYDIPLNDVVATMPASKAFVFHFIAEEAAFNMDVISQGRHPMFEKMAELGLTPIGSFYLVVEMKLIHPDGRRRSGAGRFIVPIAS